MEGELQETGKARQVEKVEKEREKERERERERERVMTGTAETSDGIGEKNQDPDVC